MTRPDLPPQVYEIEQEYTHVGRAANNEIPLPYPSISNRHCMLIQSGPEIVLRDLNSSNGTYVNGEIASEVVLRPGDVIQLGTVQMKFEPGVRRPKLTKPEEPPPDKARGELKTQVGTGALFYQTMKLPSAPARQSRTGKVKDDSVYVKGESAISYDDLAKPAVKKSRTPLIVTIVVVVLAVGRGRRLLFSPDPAATLTPPALRGTQAAPSGRAGTIMTSTRPHGFPIV